MQKVSENIAGIDLSISVGYLAVEKKPCRGLHSPLVCSCCSSEWLTFKAMLGVEVGILRRSRENESTNPPCICSMPAVMFWNDTFQNSKYKHLILKGTTVIFIILTTLLSGFQMEAIPINCPPGRDRMGKPTL